MLTVINVYRLFTTGTAIKLPTPPTQQAQLLQANETFFVAKLNASMPGFWTEKRKIIFFVNITEQTVTRNLKLQASVLTVHRIYM